MDPRLHVLIARCSEQYTVVHWLHTACDRNWYIQEVSSLGAPCCRYYKSEKCPRKFLGVSSCKRGSGLDYFWKTPWGKVNFRRSIHIPTTLSLQSTGGVGSTSLTLTLSVPPVDGEPLLMEVFLLSSGKKLALQQSQHWPCFHKKWQLWGLKVPFNPSLLAEPQLSLLLQELEQFNLAKDGCQQKAVFKCAATEFYIGGIVVPKKERILCWTGPLRHPQCISQCLFWWIYCNN